MIKRKHMNRLVVRVARARKRFWDRPHALIVVLLGVLALAFLLSLCLLDSFDEAIEVLASSLLIGSVMTGLISIILTTLLDMLLRRGEDPIKLTTDYDALVKRYEKGCGAHAESFHLRFSLFRYNNLDSDSSAKEFVRSESCCSAAGGSCKIPIDVLAFSNDGLSLSILDFPTHQYQLPGYVECHFDEVFACHESSKVSNNPMLRVEDVVCSGRDVRLTTGRTTYYDSLATNRAADYKFCEGPFVRDMFEHESCLPSLSESKLSNHLGFNVNVITHDNVVVFTLRRKNVSVAKRLYCPAVGSPVKLRYVLEGSSDKVTSEGVEHAVYCSIRDELALTKEDIDEIKSSRGLVLTAFYRDLVEAGKPQLLYNLFLPMDFDVLSNRMRNRASDRPEDVHGADSGMVKGVRTKDLRVACASPDGIAAKVVGGGVEFLTMTPSYVFSTMALLLGEVELSDW